MKKSLLFLHLLIFCRLYTIQPHSIQFLKAELESKKNYPDFAFIGKILMFGGGIGTIFMKAAILGHNNQSRIEPHVYDANLLKRCEKRLEQTQGTFCAGAIAYVIGKIFYKYSDSSLKNLFSRAALAQKIFNI